MKQRLIFIDDEQELLDIFEMMLSKEFNLKLYQSWSQLNVNELEQSDIIISDCNGVGERKEVPCTVLISSGDSSKNPDLQKPFSMDELKSYIKNLK